MSSFGINLDLRLNGETALNRAIRGAKSLESVVKRLNDKPLNLNNIGGAAQTAGGRLGKARKDVIAFAEALNKGEKSFATTEAGLREYVSAFKQLAANTQAGTKTFDTFVGALARAEKELDSIALATENARRKALGLLSVEEEAAQLAQKAAQKKAKDDEEKARKRNERAIDRENKKLEKLNKERKKERDLAKRKRGKQIGDLAASIGFPLLFGGGVGSVAGGAIGSLAGSALGLGFGGQILGSALGQGLDKATQAANEFALAATKASTSIDTLVQNFGLRGTKEAQAFGFAETLGIGGAARQAAQGSLEAIVGKNGVENLEKLAQSSEDASNALDRFGASTSSFFAPILTVFNQGVAGLFGGISSLEEKRRAEESLASIPTKQRGSAARRNRLNTRISELSASPEVAAQLKLQEKISQVVNNRIELAKDSARVEAINLTARRDRLAFEKGTLQVKAEQNKLSVLAIQLDGLEEGAKKRQLDLEKSLTEEALKQAKAARENARIEAERRIQREQISGATKQLGMLQKQRDMELQFDQIQQGRFNLFGEEMKGLKDKFVINKMTLNLENKRALIGKTEEEIISSINREFELRGRLAERQFAIDAARLEQAEAAFKLSEMQFEQELKLQNLKAATSAQQQIRQTSPFARETELLDPFFGGSRQLEIDQQIAFNEQLDLMETKLKNVVEQQEIFALSPAVRRGLKQQEESIRNQIANFKEYRPAIDEAALAQARFNEALAITVPVTDALFDNLLAVVEGTKTAKEAFADFLRSIASILMDAAKQMIATYIAIGVARAFAGMGTGGPDPNSAGVTSVLESGGFTTGNLADAAISGASFATGGYVSGPTNALVGEGGESEYIIPESKMRESMARYSRGARGSSVIPEAGGSGTSGEGGGVAVAAPIDVRYSVERINSVDYVTADQFEQGMQQAATQGAKQGEQQTLKRLQMSGSTRRRIGI